MSVLSAASQIQVEETLVSEGVITEADLQEIRAVAERDKLPVFSQLVASGKVSNEQLTKAIAVVTKVPYVNLTTAKVDPKVLDLLPQEVAERYMAVPLGEMQHRLVVAMLDADNIQAVDFLSNKVGRALKVYSASEEGIRTVLKQYKANISGQALDEISQLGDKVDADNARVEAAKRRPGEPEITTLVQDSPISKALSTPPKTVPLISILSR